MASFKSIPELRKFGLTMAGAFAVLGGILIWRTSPVGPYLLGLAAFFLVTGLVTPRLLGPIEKLWMAMAERLSVVMTFILLTLTYYLLITPFAIVIRLSGKDLLKIRTKNQDSYWRKVEPDGPASRPDKPY